MLLYSEPLINIAYLKILLRGLHYTPLTRTGLEDQLLAEVVVKERPDLEKTNLFKDFLGPGAVEIKSLQQKCGS